GRRQDRPADQEALGEDIGRELLPIDPTAGFRQANLDHLPGIVPLIYGRRGIQAFVALQPHQLATERRRKHLGDLRLADPGLTFEKQRAAHLEREKYAGRKPAVREVVVALEERENRVDVGR